MKPVFFLLFFLISIGVFGQTFLTPFEISNKKRTATYTECNQWYRTIQKAYPEITYLDSIGTGDDGNQIYVFRIYASSADDTKSRIKVLINNNIHPGEPEGTDASMLLVRDILLNQKRWNQVLENVDLSIICQYNVDGTLNRSCCSRANQNGPEEVGFRGNARNLDLNRDFIKTDSKNARAFVKYFTTKKFHILIDNHTSDGADYQYTLTYFHTRPEKLDSGLGTWLEDFNKKLVSNLDKNGWPTSPYVETMKTIPDSGIEAFWETGRFATGFAALHHCIGYTVETHMLKPFDKRVEATHAFLAEFLTTVVQKNEYKALENELQNIQNKLRYIVAKRNEKIQFVLNQNKFDSIPFLGYESSYKISSVTGLPRLFYDRNKPFKKNIPYYHFYTPTDSVNLPRYYCIPFAWHEVYEKLAMNGIKTIRSSMDSVFMLRVSYITGYESVKNPYEGHYLHYNTKTRDTIIAIQIHRGDYFVAVTEFNRAFLAAVLEPRAPDSYFNWNIFDAVLQQKEWFSDYVWVDKAEEILKSDTALKMRFEKKKTEDANFAKSSSQQLIYIYQNSIYYERTHNLYPVYRLD